MNELDNAASDLVNFESNITVNDATIKSRFSGMGWTKSIGNMNVLVVGAGGIGSWLAFNLARIGVNSITIFDDDKAECVNMSGQLIPISGIGKFKCDILADEIVRYCGSINIKSIHERFTRGESTNYDAIFCAVDNMETRRMVANMIYGREKKNAPLVFIDGRLSVDELQVYNIICSDRKQIETYLNNKNCMFDDHEAFGTICNMKQTSYMANMIGIVMTNILVNVASSLKEDSACEIPFFVKYSSQDMEFVKMEYDEWLLTNSGEE